MLESEGSGIQKIAIFGAILVAFGAIGYFATSGGSAPATDAKTAAAEPAADAGSDSKAAATTASTAGDAPAAPDSSMSASAAPAAPSPASDAAAPAPAPSPTSADTSATASADATPAAAPAPSETAAATSAPSAASEPASPPPVASASDESAAASATPHPQHHASSGTAKHKAPAKVAANAPPPALDVLNHWWAPPTATSAFRVAAVGEIEGGGGIAVVFNDEVSSWNAAAQKLQLVDANGAPVQGSWTGGANRRVMVYQHLSAGRYRLAIDPALVSVHGQTLGLPLAGPVYVQ